MTRCFFSAYHRERERQSGSWWQDGGNGGAASLQGAVVEGVGDESLR